MVGPLNGGSMDRVHVEVGVPVLSHFFHDLVPYLDCCLLSAHCDKYYEKRPSDNGARYRPPRPGNKATFNIIICAARKLDWPRSHIISFFFLPVKRN